MTNFKKTAICTLILMLLTAAFTVLALKVDVQPVGPMGSEVGFGSLNSSFFKATGTNEGIYRVTEYIGYLSIAIAASFALYGLESLIKSKGFRRLDPKFYALGATLLLLFLLYVAFNKFIVINYRPVLIAGELEPSFPSSHTMLACTVLGSTFIMFGYMFKDINWLRITGRILCVVIIIAMVLGRLLSGMHWLTDIIGGCLFSASLLSLFRLLLILVLGDSKNAKH